MKKSKRFTMTLPDARAFAAELINEHFEANKRKPGEQVTAYDWGWRDGLLEARDLFLDQALRRHSKSPTGRFSKLGPVRVAAKRKPVISVTPSSGNVFADLGLPNPEKRLRQAEAKLKAKKSKKPRGKSK